MEVRVIGISVFFFFYFFLKICSWVLFVAFFIVVCVLVLYLLFMIIAVSSHLLPSYLHGLYEAFTGQCACLCASGEDFGEGKR